MCDTIAANRAFSLSLPKVLETNLAKDGFGQRAHEHQTADTCMIDDAFASCVKERL